MFGCKETAALLREWNHILVLSHASPDGDTLGSATALLRGLSQMGKSVSFACADAIPEKFAYLLAGLTLEDPANAEHIMTVDVADEKLLGSLQEVYHGKIELAIDHHASHRSFAPLEWTEEDSAAACELIWLLLKELDVTPNKEIADCIYTGISTDSGCLRYRSATARTYRIAAETIDVGAAAGDINQKMWETKTRAQMEAEKLALASMEFFCEGHCALICLPHSILAETGAQEDELEAIPSLTRQVEGVLLGITVKEKEDGTVKVSVRANPPADATAVCVEFGGGGHTGAAGCSMDGCTLEQAVETIKAACEDYCANLLQ